MYPVAVLELLPMIKVGGGVVGEMGAIRLGAIENTRIAGVQAVRALNHTWHFKNS